MGFIPLRFIVAPLLPLLRRSVDGEIRAKNVQGERQYESPARVAGLLFWLIIPTLQLVAPRKADTRAHQIPDPEGQVRFWHIADINSDAEHVRFGG